MCSLSNVDYNIQSMDGVIYISDGMGGSMYGGNMNCNTMSCSTMNCSNMNCGNMNCGNMSTDFNLDVSGNLIVEGYILSAGNITSNSAIQGTSLSDGSLNISFGNIQNANNIHAVNFSDGILSIAEGNIENCVSAIVSTIVSNNIQCQYATFNDISGNSIYGDNFQGQIGTFSDISSNTVNCNALYINGVDFQTGVPIFSIGTVITLPAGENAYVTVSETNILEPVLNFGIPQGAEGPQGPQGNDGSGGGGGEAVDEIEIAALQSEVSGLEASVSGIQGELAILQGQVVVLEGDITTLTTDVTTLTTDITTLTTQCQNITSTPSNTVFVGTIGCENLTATANITGANLYGQAVSTMSLDSENITTSNISPSTLNPSLITVGAANCVTEVLGAISCDSIQGINPTDEIYLFSNTGTNGIINLGGENSVTNMPGILSVSGLNIGGSGSITGYDSTISIPSGTTLLAPTITTSVIQTQTGNLDISGNLSIQEMSCGVVNIYNCGGLINGLNGNTLQIGTILEVSEGLKVGNSINCESIEANEDTLDILGSTINLGSNSQIFVGETSSFQVYDIKTSIIEAISSSLNIGTSESVTTLELSHNGSGCSTTIGGENITLGYNESTVTVPNNLVVNTLQTNNIQVTTNPLNFATDVSCNLLNIGNTSCTTTILGQTLNLGAEGFTTNIYGSTINTGQFKTSVAYIDDIENYENFQIVIGSNQDVTSSLSLGNVASQTNLYGNVICNTIAPFTSGTYPNILNLGCAHANPTTVNLCCSSNSATNGSEINIGTGSAQNVINIGNANSNIFFTGYFDGIPNILHGSEQYLGTLGLTMNALQSYGTYYIFFPSTLPRVPTVTISFVSNAFSSGGGIISGCLDSVDAEGFSFYVMSSVTYDYTSSNIYIHWVALY